MSEDYFWVSIPPSTLTAASIGIENDDGSVQFIEYGTDVKLIGSHDSILDQIVDPDRVLTAFPDDLVNSDDISEAAMLYTLRQKFAKDTIYSSIGGILIALNPYKTIEGLYTSEVMEQYIADALIATPKSTIPHIYGVARNAYISLCSSAQRQAIIISGESGAGKTEATKKVMNFLSYVTESTENRQSHQISDIENKVLRTNPLLESFGNSKTCRNDNSSRFGKWLEILFALSNDGGSTLKGAHIKHYLLEKSRVVSQAKGERSYHIFYQVCAYSQQQNDKKASTTNKGIERKMNGSIDDALQGIMFGPATSYKCLNGSDCTSIDGVDDAALFADTARSFNELLISQEDRAAIYACLKAVLLLSNLEFEVSEASASEGAQITKSTGNVMSEIASCLHVAEEVLKSALTVRVLFTGKDTIQADMSMEACVDTAKSLAKEIYDRCFAFIISLVNISLDPDANAATDTSHHHQKAINQPPITTQSVGILDIFGFEIFTDNSLEQLCINFSNEKLQQNFLEYVLKKEQEIYEREGIHSEKIIPRDNEDVIALIEGGGPSGSGGVGLINRLNEEIRLPKGSDNGFLTKMDRDYTPGKTTESMVAAYESNKANGPSESVQSRFLKNVSMKEHEFSIIHFAGQVVYDSTGFVTKNKDRLSTNAEELLINVSDSSLRKIMTVKNVSISAASSSNDEKHSKNKQVTLMSSFQSQLNDLMTVLSTSTPHYVRCLKPNHNKAPDLYDTPLALEQLKYSGMLEAIQIRKKGFPVRRVHSAWAKQYWVLSGYGRSELFDNGLTGKEQCELILEGMLNIAQTLEDETMAEKVLIWMSEDIVIGETMIFYRLHVLRYLDDEINVRKYNAAIRIQAAIRRRQAMSQYGYIKMLISQLTAYIDESNADNMTNYKLVDQLQQVCDVFVKELDMSYLPILVNAGERIEALRHIKEVMDKVMYMVTPASSESMGDVCIEYSSILKLFKDIQEIGLKEEHSVEIQALREYSKGIEEKAKILLLLRTSIDKANEDDIEEMMAEVTKMERKYHLDDKNKPPPPPPKASKTVAENSNDDSQSEDHTMSSDIKEKEMPKSTEFFPVEMKAARKILLKVQNDNEHISKLVEACKLLDYRSHNTENWTESNISAFHEQVNPVFSYFKNNTPKAVATVKLLDFVTEINETIRLWKAKKWSELVVQLTLIYDNKTSLLSMLTDTEAHLSTFIRTVVSTHALPLYEDVIYHVQPSAESEYVLPMIRDGVSVGTIHRSRDAILAILMGENKYNDMLVESDSDGSGAHPKHGCVDLGAISYTRLEALLPTLSGYRWCTTTTYTIIEYVGMLCRVRRYMKEKKWEAVCRQIEETEELKKRHSDVDKLWNIAIHTIEKEGLTCALPPLPIQSDIDLDITTLDPTPVARVSNLDITSFRGCIVPMDAIHEELHIAHREASTLQMYPVLLPLVNAGAIKGPVGSIDLEVASVAVLKSVIENYALVWDISPELEFLFPHLEQLVEMRSHCITSDVGAWKKVMSLRGSDSWLDLGAGLSKMNTMDMDKNNNYGNVLLAIIRDIYNEKMVVEHDSIDHITIEMLVKAMNIGQYHHNADEGKGVDVEALKKALQYARSHVTPTPTPTTKDGADDIEENDDEDESTTQNETNNETNSNVSELCREITEFATLLMEARLVYKRVSDERSGNLIAAHTNLIAFLTAREPTSVSNSSSAAELAEEGKADEGGKAQDDGEERPISASGALFRSICSTVLPLSWITQFDSLDILDELQYMTLDVEYYTALNTITASLTPASPVTYLIPIETTPTSDGDSSREGSPVKEVSAASGRSSPVVLQQKSKDPRQLVREDGLDLNETLLSTMQLSQAIKTINEIAENGYGNVSSEANKIISVSTLIKQLRDNVRVCNWTQAFAIFSTLKSDGWITEMPMIQEELICASDCVNNYYLIALYRKALTTGAAKGPMGFLDGNKSNLKELEDAIKASMDLATVTKTSRAEHLKTAVLLICEVRTALKNQDFGALGAAIRKCNEGKIGAMGSASQFCFEEVKRAELELKNYDWSQALVSGIQEEKINMVESMMDIPAICVDKLSKVYTDCIQDMKETHRSMLLVEILSLTDIVIKARKAVMTSNHLALNSVTNLWTQECEEFKSLCENIETSENLTDIIKQYSNRHSSTIIRKASTITSTTSPKPMKKMSKVITQSIQEGDESDEEDNDNDNDKQEKTKYRDIWSRYEPLVLMMKQELLNIEQHFAVGKIETQLYTALREDGMTAAYVGSVSVSKILVEDIIAVISEKERMLAKGMVLTSKLMNVFEVAELILKLRTMIKGDKWSEISNMMEQNISFSSRELGMPEMCRKEIEYVRHECENRWLISQIKQALKTGCLEGEISEVDTESVSYEHLVACISSCKALTARTELAKNLVYTAEVVVPLRKILCLTPIDWHALRERTNDALSPAIISLLDHSILPEIRLMESVATDRILCDTLSRALTTRGPHGTPGDLDLSDVSVTDLNAACMFAIKDNVTTTKAAQLLNACRSTKSLREALMRTASMKPTIVEDAWGTLRQIVTKMFETYEGGTNDDDSETESERSSPPSPQKGKGNVTSIDGSVHGSTLDDHGEDDDDEEGEEVRVKIVDAGWALCRDEVMLLTKHAHVKEVCSNLEEIIQASMAVYQLRAEYVINTNENTQNIAGNSRTQDARYLLNTVELEELVQYIEKLTFRSMLLDQYRLVCTTLIAIRKPLMKHDWSKCADKVFDPAVHSILSSFHNALKELEVAQKECKATWAMRILEDIIFHPHQEHVTSSGSPNKDGEKASSGSNSGRNTPTPGAKPPMAPARHHHGKDGHSRHYHERPSQQWLDRYMTTFKIDEEKCTPPDDQGFDIYEREAFYRIKVIKNSDVRTKLCVQLLESSIHVFQLRHGLRTNDSYEVSEALKWFKDNGHCCPKYALEEAKLAYVTHQNDIIRSSLTLAIKEGRAVANTTGETVIDLSSVDFEKLKLYIERSDEFQMEMTAEVKDLMSAGKHVLSLRQAILSGDMLNIYDMLELMRTEAKRHSNRIHRLIIDEVAMIRLALQDEISAVALQCSLDSFNMRGNDNYDWNGLHSSHSDSFLKVVKNTEFYAYRKDAELFMQQCKSDITNEHVTSTLQLMARAYSVENKYHPDIDLASIGTSIIDEALSIAKLNGTYTKRTKKLLYANQVIRALRIAMRDKNWHLIDNTLKHLQLIPPQHHLSVQSHNRISQEGVKEDVFNPVPISELLHELCTEEVEVIKAQLEIRIAILEVRLELKQGHVRCCNGIVLGSPNQIIVEELEMKIHRARVSSDTAQRKRRETMAASNGRRLSEVAIETRVQAQEHIVRLLECAESVLKIRKLLREGRLEDAADMAYSIYLQDMQRIGVIYTEIKHYVLQLYRAQTIFHTITSLKQGIHGGDTEGLRIAIGSGTSLLLNSQMNMNSTGMIRYVRIAQNVYKEHLACIKLLKEASYSYELEDIETALIKAKKLRLTHCQHLHKVLDHVSRILEFQEYYNTTRIAQGGVIYETHHIMNILLKAKELKMDNHPWALQSMVERHLNVKALRRLHIAEACFHGSYTHAESDASYESKRAALSNHHHSSHMPVSAREIRERERIMHHEHTVMNKFKTGPLCRGIPYAAATETMRLKRHLLSQKSISDGYALHLFPRLRDRVDYSIRMSVPNKQLQESMLTHIDQNLSTSLTRLSPELAALSVWMFGHCVRGIERSIYSKLEVRLRDLTKLGRSCPVMRDEILLQILKQLSNNEDIDGCLRLWRSLACLLAHFPPSRLFENYFESFLLQQVIDLTTQADTLVSKDGRKDKAVADAEKRNHQRQMTGGIASPGGSHMISGGYSSYSSYRMKNEDNDYKVIKDTKLMLKVAQLCVRLMHESIFSYGYDSEITTPFDASLSFMKVWLNKEDISMLRSRKPLPPQTVTDMETYDNMSPSKPDYNEGIHSDGNQSANHKKEANRVDPGWLDSYDIPEESLPDALDDFSGPPSLNRAATTGGIGGTTVLGPPSMMSGGIPMSPNLLSVRGQKGKVRAISASFNTPNADEIKGESIVQKVKNSDFAAKLGALMGGRQGASTSTPKKVMETVEEKKDDDDEEDEEKDKSDTEGNAETKNDDKSTASNNSKHVKLFGHISDDDNDEDDKNRTDADTEEKNESNTAGAVPVNAAENEKKDNKEVDIPLTVYDVPWTCYGSNKFWSNKFHSFANIPLKWDDTPGALDGTTSNEITEQHEYTSFKHHNYVACEEFRNRIVHMPVPRFSNAKIETFVRAITRYHKSSRCYVSNNPLEVELLHFLVTGDSITRIVEAHRLFYFVYQKHLVKVPVQAKDTNRDSTDDKRRGRKSKSRRETTTVKKRYMLRAGDFPFYTEAENKLSRKRIAWLYDHIQVPEALERATLMDRHPTPGGRQGCLPKKVISDLCDKFWGSVITPLCEAYKLDKNGEDEELSVGGGLSTVVDTLSAMERDVKGLHQDGTNNGDGDNAVNEEGSITIGNGDAKKRSVSFYPTQDHTNNDDQSVASVDTYHSNMTGNGSISSLSTSTVETRTRRTSTVALQYLDSVKAPAEHVIGINSRIYRELVIVALYIYMEMNGGSNYGTFHDSHADGDDEAMELEHIKTEVVEIEVPTGSISHHDNGNKRAFQMFKKKK